MTGTTVIGPAPARPQARGVRVRGLRRAFGDREVLRGVDLDLAPGEFVALLGASGSGKSTLLRAVAGLDTEATGELDVPERRAVVFQEHRLLPWTRVWRNVTLGLSGRGRDLRARALQALAEVGLAARADAWPSTLSGGESQRVALARALVRTPELLLLDEPFGALDALTRLKAQGLVARLWRRHRPAVLLVTHDVEEALLLADRALVLAGGRIAEEFAVDIPRPRPVDHPRFTALRRRLLAALGVGADLGDGDPRDGTAAGRTAPEHTDDTRDDPQDDAARQETR
ncbi:MAG: ABC transporter ATP-binding protein [Actinomycetes bacterium]|jgi:sulfonate transport system ATP-binding protein|nr:MAG: sulfonate ABC transporter ATP-binding protein [Actinomycetota bacterium]